MNIRFRSTLLLTSAAGALTLANTVGAMLGALVAGFILLPKLGIELSFFTLTNTDNPIFSLKATIFIGGTTWNKFSNRRKTIFCFE